MKSYVVKSLFLVANQFMHIELGVRNNSGVSRVIQLPYKNVGDLKKGDRFDIFFAGNSNSEIAYFYKNRIYFTHPMLNRDTARTAMHSIPGITSGSLNRLWFKYALLMAMQVYGVRPYANWAKIMVELDKVAVR